MELPILTRHAAPFATGDPSIAGLRIAHLSDLHYFRWNRVLERTQTMLGTLSYDLLAVTGDFCTRPFMWRRTLRFMREFFAPIAAQRPIVAVLGNHDHPNVGDADLPLTMLRNAFTELEFGRRRLRIAGVEQFRPGQGDVAAAVGADDGSPTLLLAHYPSTVFRHSQARVGLQLSGHTHGGQIRLPRVGCLWSNDRLPARYAHGLHRLNGTTLHVSAGIGVSPPIPIRLNCPPEFSILTIEPISLSEA